MAMERKHETPPRGNYGATLTPGGQYYQPKTKFKKWVYITKIRSYMLFINWVCLGFLQIRPLNKLKLFLSN